MSCRLRPAEHLGRTRGFDVGVTRHRPPDHSLLSGREKLYKRESVALRLRVAWMRPVWTPRKPGWDARGGRI